MKLKGFNLVLFGALLLNVGCGDKSNRNGNYPVHGLSNWGEGGSYRPASSAMELMTQNIPCRSGLGPNRAPFSFHTSGAFGNGYRGTLLRGPLEGEAVGVYMGVSYAGDFIEIRQMSHGRAAIFLLLCEQYPLVTNGRQIVQAAIFKGSITIKSRSECEANEVTAANLSLTAGPYRGLGEVRFPVSFTRLEDIYPQICQRR